MIYEIIRPFKYFGIKTPKFKYEIPYLRPWLILFWKVWFSYECSNRERLDYFTCYKHPEVVSRVFISSRQNRLLHNCIFQIGIYWGRLNKLNATDIRFTLSHHNVYANFCFVSLIPHIFSYFNKYGHVNYCECKFSFGKWITIKYLSGGTACYSIFLLSRNVV